MLGADHLLTLNYRENVIDKAKLKRDWQEFVDEVGTETLGQIDMSGPKYRWRDHATHGLTWNANKLGAYMTKYIHKTFDESAKHAKRYWASKGIKIDQQCFWLAACSFTDAVIETYDRLENLGNYGLDVRVRQDDGIIWLSASYREEILCPI